MAEGLVGLVRATDSKGHYERVKLGSNSIGVNLLQFADDTLFFYQPTYKCIMVVKTILQCFELVSGLKVNFHKRSVGIIGVDDMDLSIFSNCINFSVMHLPFKYLGLIIGGNHRFVSFWKPIVDKIKNRLSRWKGRLMLLAGRVCLIKSVLSPLPLFYLSFFKALTTISKLIRKIQIWFLWGWGHDDRKIAWISWDKVCTPKEMGGLGVSDISRFNVALVAKWK